MPGVNSAETTVVVGLGAPTGAVVLAAPGSPGAPVALQYALAQATRVYPAADEDEDDEAEDEEAGLPAAALHAM